MPYFEIQTNLKMDEKKATQLAEAASAHIAGLLGKPEKYVMVGIRQGIPMLFGGSAAPSAYLILKSIGLAAEDCTGLSKDICAFIEKQIGIAADRIYIDFANIDPRMFGWNSATF